MSSRWLENWLYDRLGCKNQMREEGREYRTDLLHQGIKSVEGAGRRESTDKGVEVMVGGAAGTGRSRRWHSALVLIQHRKEGRRQSLIYSCTWTRSVQPTPQFRATYDHRAHFHCKCLQLYLSLILR